MQKHVLGLTARRYHQHAETAGNRLFSNI